MNRKGKMIGIVGILFLLMVPTVIAGERYASKSFWKQIDNNPSTIQIVSKPCSDKSCFDVLNNWRNL